MKPIGYRKLKFFWREWFFVHASDLLFHACALFIHAIDLLNHARDPVTVQRTEYADARAELLESLLTQKQVAVASVTPYIQINR